MCAGPVVRGTTYPLHFHSYCRRHQFKTKAIPSFSFDQGSLAPLNSFRFANSTVGLTIFLP